MLTAIGIGTLAAGWRQLLSDVLGLPLYAVDVPAASGRGAALLGAHAAGLLLRPAWRLMPALPMYQDCPRASLPVAEALEARLVCLPSGPALIGPGCH